MQDRTITRGEATTYLISNVDIYEYPNEITKHPEGTVLTIADLHGNFAKLLHILVREGVIDISPEHYNHLIKVYKYSNLLYEEKTENTNIFLNILFQHVTAAQPHLTIRYLGDDVCDRGKNDFLTILTDRVLSQLGITLEIIESNHGLEFLAQFAHGLDKGAIIAFNGDGAHQAASLYALMDDIQDNLIDVAEINDLIQNHYIPNLKLLSYCVSGDELILYSHAPINASRIRGLAESLDIIVEFSNLNGMIETIDLINSVFLKKISDGATSKAWINDFYSNQKVRNFFWGRNEIVNDDKEIFSFKVTNIHGHLGELPIDANTVKNDWKYINLDGFLGRPGEKHQVGNYYIIVSTESQCVLENSSSNTSSSSSHETSESESSESEKNESNYNDGNRYNPFYVVQSIDVYYTFIEKNSNSIFPKKDLLSAINETQQKTIEPDKKITEIFMLVNAALEKEKYYYNTSILDKNLSYKEISFFEEKKASFETEISKSITENDQLSHAKSLRSLLIMIYKEHKDSLSITVVEKVFQDWGLNALITKTNSLSGSK